MRTFRSGMDHFPRPIEFLILILIVLVIGLIVLEELAIVYAWSHETMVQLLIAAFVFDFLFTVEFIGRSLISAKHGQFRNYITRQRGWIDFVSSVPLLLLVSGPALYVALFSESGSGGLLAFLSILKTAKAVRVTRILRLIRVIKLLGKIQNTESAMTNRHVGMIATIGVTTLVIVLFVSQFLPFVHVGDRGPHIERLNASLAALLDANRPRGEGPPDLLWIGEHIARNPALADVIRLRDANQRVVYLSGDADELIWSAHKNGAWVPVGRTGYEAQLSYRSADAEHAKLNLLILCGILAMVGAYMFVYTREMAQTIADPIFVMNKGIREWEYNLEVRVAPSFEDEEVFQLARAYNNRWLAIKNQIRAYRRKKEGGGGGISLNDVL